MIELGGIVILGIAAQWLAWKMRVPAILPLILAGLAVGPVAEYLLHHKLINPEYSPEHPHGLFPGQGLFHFVELAIAVILFEGGLTLKRSEIKNVGPAIMKLISLGSLVTFVGGGLAAHYVLGLSWPIAFLFGALIIVTGPTVIAPILRNVPLNRNVAAVLKWEGILIDPIGALAAVIVYNFILTGINVGIENTAHGASFTVDALLGFGQIIVTGFAVGFGFAWILAQMIERKMIPHYLLNVFSLAMVLAAFILANVLAHDSGLLTVVVMGMTMGNMEIKELKEILDFKESITVLLISILFILLSANINVDQLELINGNMLIVFAIVVFVLRPLGVLLSTQGSKLSFNEKLFISWVGPRGIVAAGIASLFGLQLVQKGVPGADFITPLVFLIVLGTVLLNATTARVIASLLGVTQVDSNGIMIVGASPATRLIAKYLVENGREVMLVDSNKTSVEDSIKMGLSAIEGNIYNDEFKERFELLSMGYLLAMTGNDQVNKVAIERLEANYGENGSYRFVASKELTSGVIKEPKKTLFSPTDDYINFSEVARDYPTIHEYSLTSQEHFQKTLETIFSKRRIIPLFLKNKDGVLNIITSEITQKFAEGDQLVYLGKELE